MWFIIFFQIKGFQLFLAIIGVVSSKPKHVFNSWQPVNSVWWMCPIQIARCYISWRCLWWCACGLFSKYRGSWRSCAGLQQRRLHWTCTYLTRMWVTIRNCVVYWPHGIDIIEFSADIWNNLNYFLYFLIVQCVYMVFMGIFYGIFTGNFNDFGILYFLIDFCWFSFGLIYSTLPLFTFIYPVLGLELINHVI